MAFFADAQAALGALCLALLILCLCMQARTRRFLRRMHEEQLRGQDAQANDVAQQNARQREELLQSMHQLNESLTNTFGGISRAQGEQVNALIRQSYDNAQAFDLRQQGM